MNKDLINSDESNSSQSSNETDNSQEFSQNTSLLKLDFNGKAYFDEEKTNKSEYSKFLHILNQNNIEIAEEIKRELRQQIPVGLDIKVQLEFKLGSFSFEGIIQVIDFLDKLNGAKELIIAVATLAINNILRKRIESDTNVEVQKIDTKVEEGILTSDDIHIVTKFFWWCSGAYSDLLKECPTDKSKYQCIGIAVFLTGVLGFFSGGYALYTVFDGDANAGYLGILFGLLWGFVIFNIDRSIVSTMRKNTDENVSWIIKLAKELLPAIPRIALAFLLAVTIAKPLELRLFAGPIQTQIELNKDKYVKEKADSLYQSQKLRIDQIDNRLNAINSEINSASDGLTSAQQKYNEEINGKGGSGRYGVSVVAEQVKKTILEPAETKYNNAVNATKAEKISLEQQKDEISKDIKLKSEESKTLVKNDFLTRLKALWDLTEKKEETSPNEQKENDSINKQTGNGFWIWLFGNRNGIAWVDLGIFLLFFTIEVTPILIKLLSAAGTYDARLFQRESSEIKEAEMRKQTLVSEAKLNNDCIVSEAGSAFDTRKRIAQEKSEANITIAHNHYGLMITSEQNFDRRFFELTDAKRQEILESDFNLWLYDNNFEEFYRQEKRRLSINKNMI